jgi:hypothetical protein
LSSGRTDFFQMWLPVEPHYFKMPHHLTVQPSWSSLCKPTYTFYNLLMWNVFGTQCSMLAKNAVKWLEDACNLNVVVIWIPLDWMASFSIKTKNKTYREREGRSSREWRSSCPRSNFWNEKNSTIFFIQRI